MMDDYPYVRRATEPTRPLRIRLLREAGGLGDVVCCLQALSFLHREFAKNGLTRRAIRLADPEGTLGLAEGEPCELHLYGLGVYRTLWEMSGIEYVWHNHDCAGTGRRGRWVEPRVHYREEENEWLYEVDLWCPFWRHEIADNPGHPVLGRDEIACSLAGMDPHEYGPPKLTPPGEALTWARDWLRFLGRKHEPVVLLFPLCAGPARIWPAERWEQVALKLWRERGARVIVCAQRRRDVAWWEQRPFQVLTNLVDPDCEVTGWRRLASLVQAADLVMSGDTGPYHLAAAVDTPALGLFGMTSGEITSRHYPLARWLQGGRGRTLRSDLDVTCRAPCYHRWQDGFGGDRCKQTGCESLMAITPARAYEAACAILDETKKETA